MLHTSIHKQDSSIIVYDADLIQQPGTHLFAADDWERSGSIVGQAPGRGNALFLESGFGPAVLRRYLRGGWAAQLSREHYLYTGFERSRPVVEFYLLARLFEQGLPVPRPLAALCARKGFYYSGDLITRRLLNVVPLADLTGSRQNDREMWHATGACIRTFHNHGVVHADLNARNILIGRENSVYLIDFDRARIRAGAGRLFEANLNRLQRSLQKFLSSRQVEQGWHYFQRGYMESPPGQLNSKPDGACQQHQDSH